MLNAITLKSSRAAVVQMQRTRDGDGTLGIHQPLAIVLVDGEIIGNDVELVAGHFENFVVVNRHEARGGVSAGKCRGYLPWIIVASNAKRHKACPARGAIALAKARAKSNRSTMANEFVTSRPTHENGNSRRACRQAHRSRNPRRLSAHSSLH